MSITFPLTAGLIASILHVITGPDHLAAVMPFAVESKKKAWKIWTVMWNRPFGRDALNRYIIYTF